MGLRQTLAEWIKIAKDTLDLGPEFPAAMEARHVELTERLAKLQSLLEQARKASQEKDAIIAKLRAAGGVAGDMVLDGPVCFIRKENTLEGPYCTSCFQQNHETSRIVPASKPDGADGPGTDWVQCTRCRTPFCSERISHYLNPRPAAPAPSAVSPEGESQMGPAKARRPRTPSRQRKSQQSEPMEAFGDST